MPSPRRALTLLLLHAVLTQAVTFVLRPATSYRALELGIPASWLGVLAASFAIVPLVLAVPSGQAVDRFGERRVMLVGALLMCLACLTFVLLGSSAAGLVATNIVLGVGHLCSVVGEQALVANTTGRGQLDAVFGYYTFAASLGQAVGPGLIVLLGGTAVVPDVSRILAGAAVLAVGLVVSTLLLRVHGAAPRPTGPSPLGLASLVRLPGLPRALVTSSVVLAAVDITVVYLPALGVERGLASGAVGALLALRAGASMTSRVFLARLVRVLGRRRLLLISLAAAAGSLMVIPLPMPLWLLAIVVVVLGLGLGVGQPITMSWLAEAAPAGLRGRAMSLRLTGNRLGQVLVPSTVGLVAAALGAGGVLWATAAGLSAVGVLARRLPLEGDPGRDDNH